MRMHPDSDAASYIAAANSVAQPLVEHHEESVYLADAKEEGS
jgi:hypothetical protein